MSTTNPEVTFHTASATVEAIARIDWKQLREQKQWLLETSENEICQGIVAMMDAIQDAAVADGLASEAQVFGVESALFTSLEDILARFKSCIAGGNGEQPDDAKAIAEAESALNFYMQAEPVRNSIEEFEAAATEFNRAVDNAEQVPFPPSTYAVYVVLEVHAVDAQQAKERAVDSVKKSAFVSYRNIFDTIQWVK